MISTIITAIYLIISYVSAQQCAFPNERCICVTNPLCACTSITSISTLNFSTSYRSHLVLQTGLGCLPCPASCLQCTSTSACTACQNQYMLINNTCLSCPINCQTCNIMANPAYNVGIPNLQCTSCLQGYYLDEKFTCQLCALTGSSQCTSDTIISCLPSYWLDNNGATCVSCDPNCIQCSSTTKCSICNNGYYLSSFKCLKCMAQCSTCLNANSCSACLSSNLYFDSSSGTCVSCGAACLSCLNSTYCLTCGDSNNTRYALSASGTCLVASNSSVLPNCLQTSIINSTLRCLICENDYFQQVGDSSCHYGCSILCATCHGAHYGLCSTCQPNSNLLNRNCIPRNNINNGSAFQTYITAVHNFNKNFFYNVSSLTLVTRLLNRCLKQSIISGPSIQIYLSNSQAYQITLIWKIYLQSTNSTNLTYRIIFDNSKRSRISNFECNISMWQAGCDNICVSKANLTISGNINQNNSIRFQPISDGVNVGFAELLVISYRCGGISGAQCLECSSINQCTKCLNPLFYILGETCIQQCPPTYYVEPEARKCYLICPVGTFNLQATNGKKICQTCPLQCLTCTSNSTCFSCKTGYFLNQQLQQCLSSCPARYFQNFYLNTCEKCQFPCYECRSSRECLSCLYGFYDSSAFACTMACPSGFYGNLSTRTCESCQSPCSTCQLSATNCIMCYKNFVLMNGKCHQNCPAGYYLNTTNSSKQCNLCKPQCRQCDNFNTCLSCSYGFYFNGSCLASCPIQFYASLINFTCETCSTSCLLCTNKTHCTLCLPQNSLDQATYDCVSNCPSLYYSQLLIYNQLKELNISTFFVCKPCMPPCHQCLNSTYCLSCYSSFLLDSSCVETCIDGTFPNQKNLTCTICPAECALCKSSIQCTSCKQNFTLFDNKCVAYCPSFYYLDHNSKACLQCSYQCAKCYNSSYCYQCIPGLIVSSIGQCVSSCPTGFWPDFISSKTCKTCSQHCYECQVSQTTYIQQCLVCEAPYFLTNLATCQVKCGVTQFGLGGMCFQCKKPCSTCISSSQCSSCLGGYGYAFLGDCVAACPEGYFQLSSASGNICQPCSNNCISCLGNINKTDFICLGCNQSYYLLKSTSQCITARQCFQLKNVSNGYFPLQYSKVCSRCALNCLTCFGSSKNCTSCLPDLFYLSGQCFDICPNGYYGFNRSCINCNANQLTIKCINCRSEKICLQCSAGYFLFTVNNTYSTCLSTCPQGFYGGSSSLCYKCSYPCLNCVSIQKCTACEPGYVLLTDSQMTCVSACPSGYYLNKISSNNLACDACLANCTDCLSASQCLSCESSFFLVNNSCKSQCPFGTYSFYGICLPCMYGCGNCTNAFTCSQCISGFLYLGQCIQQCPYGLIQDHGSSSHACIPCNSNCQSCSVSSNICTSCTSSLYLFLQKCLAECPPGSYPDPSLGQCVTCTSPCQTCTNSDSCQTCIYGYILYAQQTRNQCVKGPICPNGYFLDLVHNFCKIKCNASEIQYTQSISRTCSSKCPQGFVAYEKNMTCLYECPQSDMWIDDKNTCVDGKSRLGSQFILDNLPFANCNFSNYKNLLQILCRFSLPITNLQEISAQNIVIQQMQILYFTILDDLQGLQIIAQPNSTQIKLKSKFLKIGFRPRYQLYAQVKRPETVLRSLQSAQNQYTRYPLQNSGITVFVQLFNFYSQQQRQTGLFLGQLANGISIAAIIVWAFAFIKNKKSIALVWINGLQWLYLLSTTNHNNYPPNLLNFISGFRVTNLILFGQNIEQLKLNLSDSLWNNSQIRLQLISPFNLFDFKTISFPAFGFFSIFLALFLLLLSLFLLFRKLAQCKNNKGQNNSQQNGQNSSNLIHKSQKDKESRNFSCRNSKQKISTNYQDLAKKVSIMLERFKSNYLHHVILFTTIPMSAMFFCQLLCPQIAGLTTGLIFTALLIVSWVYFCYQLKFNKFPLFKQQGYKYYIIFSIQGYLISLVCILGSTNLLIGSCSILFLLNIYVYFAIFRISQWKLKFWCSLELCRILIIAGLFACSILSEKEDSDTLFAIGWGPIILIIIYVMILALCSARDFFEQQSIAFKQIVELQQKDKKDKTNVAKPLLLPLNQPEDNLDNNPQVKINSRYNSQANIKYESQESFWQDQEEAEHTDSQDENYTFQQSQKGNANRQRVSILIKHEKDKKDL